MTFNYMIIAISLHLLAVIIWVGGMFFAYWILRPAAQQLETSERLRFWYNVFGRFLPLAGGAALILLITGYSMIYLRGSGVLEFYVRLMEGLGWIMIGLFAYLCLVPWRRFSEAMKAPEDSELRNHAPQHLARIRVIVTINMMLGLIISIIGASGRFW